MLNQVLLKKVREKFAHIDSCPYQGARIYFENAGGSLTLKSAVKANTKFSAMPDNQGRDNPASEHLVKIIQRAKSDMMIFLGAHQGMVFVGETGTECLFRMIRTAITGAAKGGSVLGSTLEHPATTSAGKRWAQMTEKNYIAVPHNPKAGIVTADAYRQHVNSDTRVATIIETSPVTGMTVDIESIVQTIRHASPQCFIIVDGIQHAPHGNLCIDHYEIDGFALSAYKIFSIHNYGIGWLSPRLSILSHDQLEGTADDKWELGTRNTAAYATFSEVINYLDWLGAQHTDSTDRRARIVAAGKAISAHEKQLINAMLFGVDEEKGLADRAEIYIIGGADNPSREGLVSFAVQGMPCAKVVSQLGQLGVRVHIRKNDHFSTNVLTPLKMETCIRVSLCHYNSMAEVSHFLKAMSSILS